VTLVMDHAAAVLLRLMRSKRQPSVDQERSEPGLENRSLSVRQREVRLSDFESVAKLKERWGLGTDTWDNWCRLWQRNPALAVVKSQLSMGWVLETERGIVGYQGSVPLLYQFAGRTLLAAAGTSLVVEPEYRARSVGLLASFYQQPGVDLVLITTAIPSVGELSKALRAKALPQHDYDTVLFWVLDTREFAKAVATRLGFDGGVAALGTVLGSLALRTDSRIHRRHPRQITHLGVTEIQVDDIGDEFQALWQRKASEKPRLMAERSLLCLRWHFTIPGRTSRTVVLCRHRSDRLIGYAIVQHRVDPTTGMRKCLLADILVEQDDSSVIASLLGAAYANAVSSGDHVFEVVGLPRNVRQIFMSRHPYLRAYPALPFFYKVMDKGLAQTLADENAWYAGPFDGDTTLMR
jgi:hypothetical protein